MKPVFLRFTDAEGKTMKTFTATTLKTGMMDTIFDIAERAESFDKGETPPIKELRAFYADIKALFVSVFGHKFTYDEINEHVEVNELMNAFQVLCKHSMGGMQKN